MPKCDYHAKYAKIAIFKFSSKTLFWGMSVKMVVVLEPQNVSKSQKPQNYREPQMEGFLNLGLRKLRSAHLRVLLGVVLQLA
jgi:hypothetical protein